MLICECDDGQSASVSISHKKGRIARASPHDASVQKCFHRLQFYGRTDIGTSLACSSPEPRLLSKDRRAKLHLCEQYVGCLATIPSFLEIRGTLVNHAITHPPGATQASPTNRWEVLRLRGLGLSFLSLSLCSHICGKYGQDQVSRRGQLQISSF